MDWKELEQDLLGSPDAIVAYLRVAIASKDFMTIAEAIYYAEKALTHIQAEHEPLQ